MDRGRRSLSILASKKIYGPLVGLLEGCLGVNGGVCKPWDSVVAQAMEGHEAVQALSSVVGPEQSSMTEIQISREKVGIQMDNCVDGSSTC